VLTTVAQVRALSKEQAARHVPVRLRGVVTVLPGWQDSFFVQDATGGIAVDRAEHGVAVHAGDLVEVTGTSNPGLFASSLDETALRVLGAGTMPKSRIYSYPELEGGEQDAAWIEVRGVVQSARQENLWGRRVLVLHMEIGGGLITVRLLQFDIDDESRLVDALVRVRGVCGTVYNDKRQFTGIRLFATDARDIYMEEGAPGDPFHSQTNPVRSVMQAGTNPRLGHRVKISGIVTYQDPGRALYLQDGNDGILVTSDQATRVKPGTRIEAVGFPAMGTSSPMLRNAVFRTVGTAHVEPALIRADDFLKQKANFSFVQYENQLVRLRGVVVSPLALPIEYAWLLQDSTGDFAAYLPRRPGSPKPPNIEVGSTVEVTGIYVASVDEYGQPRAFRILMRGPADMVVLKHAPWWTARHLMMVLGLALAMVLATTSWVLMLRKRVTEQTRQLRESEERFRKQAQHDTLTGLASRSFLHEKLREEISRAQRSNGRIGVLMVDLDHFKDVNDTLGHHAGDELLRIVAARIRSSVRKHDTVARMGGDEFVVLLTGIRSISEAELIGATVVSNVSAPAMVGTESMLVSASVGVCTYPEGGSDGDSLLQVVDAEMYKAKAGGRNTFSVYTRGQVTIQRQG
jgi:diguanylate cyclase (GGDEF)-like protein